MAASNSLIFAEDFDGAKFPGVTLVGKGLSVAGAALAGPDFVSVNPAAMHVKGPLSVQRPFSVSRTLSVFIYATSFITSGAGAL